MATQDTESTASVALGALGSRDGYETFLQAVSLMTRDEYDRFKTEVRGVGASDAIKTARRFMGSDVLDDDSFWSAWEDWVRYRAEARKKLTTTTIKRQIRQLEAMGLRKAIASIDQSITAGYQGLFEPKESLPPNGRPRTQTREERENDMTPVL